MPLQTSTLVVPGTGWNRLRGNTGRVGLDLWTDSAVVYIHDARKTAATEGGRMIQNFLYQWRKRVHPWIVDEVWFYTSNATAVNVYVLESIQSGP
jgi:hypothetical protein